MSALSMRRGWCPGARRPMETGDGLLVRVHPPGGVLSAAQACSLADAAEVCGNGLLDVTARGNLQIRGVSETTHPAVLERLSAIGLLEDEAAEGPYRLTLTSPLAGIDPGARFDTAALAEAIERAAKHISLPAKFYIAVDGGGAIRLEPGADIWIAPAGDGVAVGLAAGEEYLWHGPIPLADAATAVARAIDGFTRHRGSARRMRDMPPDAAEAIATVSFPVGEGGSAKPRRMGHAEGVFREAETELLRTVRPCTNSASPNAPSARPIRHAACGGAPPSPTGKEKGRACAAGFIGASALLLALPFGRATAAQLRAAAQWSATHGAGEIRLSFTRGVLIPHLSREAAARIAHEADATGFVTDPADPRVALVACPGAPACGRANTPAPADALALARAAGGGYRVHVSACPKGCAHPRTEDLTLVGRPDGRYDVIPGGAAGDEPAAALTLPEIAAILRRTPHPSGLPAAFEGPER